MKCFKINKLFQDNIVMCLEDEYIHRKAQWKIIHDKCYWPAYVKINNMHSSNDVFFRFHMSCDRGTDKLRICVFYALKIVKYSIFLKTLRTNTQTLFSLTQLFWNVSVSICFCLHSVSVWFRTFCKFPPKPLPLTAYQECKRPNLRYVMHFPSLQNGLINCFNVSRLLIVFDQYFIIWLVLIVLRFKYWTTVIAKQSEILCSVFASSCDVQKERYLLDRSKWPLTLFIHRICRMRL